MTGGIGFSRQGRQSFEDNRKLLKANEPHYRSKKDKYFSKRKINYKITKEDIHYLIMVKRAKAKQAIRSKIGVYFILITIVLLFLWYMYSFH